MKTKALIRKLATRFPKRLADKGDHIGLMTGQLKEETRTIVVCLDFDEEVKLSKAKDLFPALLRKYQKVDIGKRKERIYHSLLNAGFDYSVISSLLSEQDFASPENDERLLKKAYNQAKIKYQNEDPKQRRVKIVRYLRQRGYNYSDIAQLLEEDDDEY